jgi:hypothetical protein
LKRVINLVVLFVLLSTSLISAQQVPVQRIRNLSEQRIKTKQSNLQKKIKRHTKIRNVLLVAGGAMTAVSLYKMIREFVSVTKGLNSGVQAPKPDQKWQDKAAAFATGLGLFCLETSGAIVINYALGEFLGKILYDESLAWWLTSHAPYQQTIELMEETVEHYAHPLSSEEATRYQERFVSLANSLCDQFELVLAFMRYKSTFGLAHDKVLKREIEHIVRERMSGFMVELQRLVDINELHAVDSEISQFKAQFNQDLVKFAYIDQ